MRIAGHTITEREMVALHGLYRGLVKQESGAARVFGVSVSRQLRALADRQIISGTGLGAYMIPWGSPGEEIINESPDFEISAHI